MPTKKTPSLYAADVVDAYIATKKHLAGNAAWEIGNRKEERRASWSVMYNNELRGGYAGNGISLRESFAIYTNP
jgi:hypothetical protein